mmetsp:Transcript_41542/g.93870  ORF Transcript_41542/g.93870 Transcript_41542/m.93870 type:complete len:290 (-) Transcript_41542:433-1302(-)
MARCRPTRVSALVFVKATVISTAAGAGATAGCVKSGFTVDLPPRVALPAACPPSLAFSPPAAPPPRAPSTAAPALLDASMLPPPFSELETGFTAPMRAASACFLQKSINWTELSLVNAGLVPMPAMKLGLERSARSWTVDTTLGSSVSSVCRQWRTSSTEKTSERSALTGAKLASYAGIAWKCLRQASSRGKMLSLNMASRTWSSWSISGSRKRSAIVISSPAKKIVPCLVRALSISCHISRAFSSLAAWSVWPVCAKIERRNNVDCRAPSCLKCSQYSTRARTTGSDG